MKAIPDKDPPEWMLDPVPCEGGCGWIELASAFHCDDGPTLCGDCAPTPGQVQMSRPDGSEIV